MEPETFRPRKPAVTNETPEVPAFSNLPPQVQNALRKNAERMAEGQETEVQHTPGPRLAYTGNAKLDQLIEGIKETIHRYEEVTLPSMGKFYDNGGAPTDGVINVRCMTGEEEQILATPRFVKKGQAINMIFRNCVRESISPDQLLTIDRTWLLIYLRGISYGTDYEVEVRCSECGTRQQATIDLDSLAVSRCPTEFGPQSLAETLPKSGYKFTYRLANGKDENTIQKHRDQRMRKENEDDADDTWLYRASLLISDFEGLTDQSSIMTLISRLHIQDVSYIRTVLAEPPFGVDTKVSLLCKNCWEEFQVELPMDANFFFPRIKKTKKTQA